MSLRWRLTFLSTLITAVVFAIFGVLAFYTVRFSFYKAIDDNLDRETAANVLYIQSHANSDYSKLQEDSQIGTVFYTVYTADGQVVVSQRRVPLNEELFNQTLSGVSTKGIVSLPDGSRVRVLMKPLTDSIGRVTGVLEAATPLGFVDEILNQLRFILFVTGLVLLASVVAFSHLLTGRALRAVEEVTQKARQIELSQDLSQRIAPPGTDDEVGHLVATFNRMLEKLEAAFEAQRRFVADSSHELRTPLTVIKSNLHMLRREPNPRERAELIEITEAEVSRLNRMVNDLLYMAQMQAGHDPRPVMRPVELDSLMLEIFARAHSMAALKNQKVILAHEDIATAQGDRDQLQHLLLNLVDNATKYTPPGGTVSLGLWNDGGWARIEVTDTGPGIAEEEISYLFERFYRSPDARQHERSGSGLGLAIVQSIAESHGGQVEVFSRVGEGSTFRLWLRTTEQASTAPLPEPPQHLLTTGGLARPSEDE